jgi:hypothetical protein
MQLLRKTKKIDFVVLWLDSNDPVWIKTYNDYRPEKPIQDRARFRNWNIFHYWFRAVEEYAPWVNKVYLITNGKFPDWINSNCEKLVLVKHSDYIPDKYLPTFNAMTIELNLGRIEGLSEHFVFFNDDMFLNAPVKPEYYFRNGLPCDMNKETCFNVPIYTQNDKYGIYMTMLADTGVINGHFDRKRTVRQSPKRWFGPHLGIRGIVMSFLLFQRRLFIGFSNFHLEQAYLKSTIAEVWEKEPDFMNDSCTRFREDIIANQYLFRYWQFAKNLFYPEKRNGAFFFLIKRDVLDRIEKVFNNKHCYSICLNDSPLCTDEEFEHISKGLQQLFETKFPHKSSFEK